MALPPAAEVIEATLAPAFLISATSVFLNFAQNRLFRVVDRLRADPATAEDAGGTHRLVRRARILRNGIACGVLTVGLTIAAAILVMASQLSGSAALDHAAPYAFGLALVSLFAALLYVFADTMLSVANVETRGR
jgi:hypothetical protein